MRHKFVALKKDKYSTVNSHGCNRLHYSLHNLKGTCYILFFLGLYLWMIHVHLPEGEIEGMFSFLALSYKSREDLLLRVNHMISWMNLEFHLQVLREDIERLKRPTRENQAVNIQLSKYLSECIFSTQASESEDNIIVNHHGVVIVIIAFVLRYGEVEVLQLL